MLIQRTFYLVAIINYLFKIKNNEEILPEISRRSIQRRLKQLVDEGYLELVGETREAKYVLSKKQ